MPNPTIYDIAKASGVSIATVSRVFNKNVRVNEKTRQKVLTVAKDMGYHPKAFARGLASNKSRIITALVPVVSNYFFMEILAGMQNKIAEYDYDLIIYNIRGEHDILDQIEHAVRKGLSEGYVFISIHLNEIGWKRVSDLEVPVVLVDEYFSKFDSVSVDSIEGSYTATNYLVGQGFDTIGVIAANERAKPTQDRLLGYRRALEDNGKLVNSDFIFYAENPHRDGFTEQAGYDSFMTMMSGSVIPDAIFCTSDIQALGAKKAMNDLKTYIPMVSFDDIEVAEYFGLTTMRQPLQEMGEIAIERLLERMNTPEIDVKHTIYSPELVIRQTSELVPHNNTL